MFAGDCLVRARYRMMRRMTLPLEAFNSFSRSSPKALLGDTGAMTWLFKWKERLRCKECSLGPRARLHWRKEVEGVLVQWMFPFICLDIGRQTKSHHRTCHRIPANALLILACPVSEPSQVRCERGEEIPHCKVVSDLLRRFPDLLESQSSQPNHLSPSPLINHVTHLTGSHPRPPPAHRSNINPQPP